MKNNILFLLFVGCIIGGCSKDERSNPYYTEGQLANLYSLCGHNWVWNGNSYREEKTLRFYTNGDTPFHIKAEDVVLLEVDCIVDGIIWEFYWFKNNNYPSGNTVETYSYFRLTSNDEIEIFHIPYASTPDGITIRQLFNNLPNSSSGYTLPYTVCEEPFSSYLQLNGTTYQGW